MDVFVALADPTRRSIIELLANGEQAFGTIADRFSMSRPAVSQHLKVLRDAGFVSVRKDAQRRIYRLEPEALSNLDQWLCRVRTYWNERLDTLEEVLQQSDE